MLYPFLVADAKFTKLDDYLRILVKILEMLAIPDIKKAH